MISRKEDDNRAQIYQVQGYQKSGRWRLVKVVWAAFPKWKLISESKPPFPNHTSTSVLLAITMRILKKSWRPAFGQFWSYRTSPWLILTNITQIFEGYYQKWRHRWGNPGGATYLPSVKEEVAAVGTSQCYLRHWVCQTQIIILDIPEAYCHFLGTFSWKEENVITNSWHWSDQSDR